MALTASLYHDIGQVIFMLYSGEFKDRTADDPDERNWPFWIFWDAPKLDRGEREFLGIEVLDVSDITDYWLNELEKLDLPLIDVPEANLRDVSVADALRWARQTYPSRYARVSN